MTTMASAPCGREESRQALSRNEMLTTLIFSRRERDIEITHAAGHFKDSGEGRKEEAFGFNCQLTGHGSSNMCVLACVCFKNVT